MAEISGLRGKVAQVQAGGWRGWPASPLEQAAVAPDTVFAPIDLAIGARAAESAATSA